MRSDLVRLEEDKSSFGPIVEGAVGARTYITKR